MTHLQMLQTDLEIHRTSLAEMENGTGGYFLRREGYSVAPLIETYKRIIASIEAEISTLTKKGKSHA